MTRPPADASRSCAMSASGSSTFRQSVAAIARAAAVPTRSQRRQRNQRDGDAAYQPRPAPRPVGYRVGAEDQREDEHGDDDELEEAVPRVVRVRQSDTLL